MMKLVFKKFFLFSWLVLFFSGVSYSQNFDLRVLEQLNSSHPTREPFWHQGVSSSIYWVPATYLVGNLSYGIIAKNSRALHYSFETGASFVISQGITELLKITVNRPRPYISYPDQIHSYDSNPSKSFPSGHTSFSFAVATTMSYEANRWFTTVPIMVWPISVGYSRMRLGKHYPTDVLAGAIIGLGSGILSHWATREILGPIH